MYRVIDYGLRVEEVHKANSALYMDIYDIATIKISTATDIG